MSSTRSITYIAVGVLALVLAGAVVVLLAGARSPKSFPADSPQAAMQGYLAAWQDHDIEASYGYFSDAIRRGTSLDEYERGVREYGESFPGDEAVYIDAAEGTADRTTLHLTVERYYGDGPGSEVYRSAATVRMVRQADGWKIDQPLIGLEQTPFPFDGQPI